MLCSFRLCLGLAMHLSTALFRETPGLPNVARLLRCQGVTLDLDRRCGTVGGVDVRLSAAEFATVKQLFLHRGTPMSREAIGAGLPVRVDLRMIDVYVSRARAKLAACGADGVIETVSGRGYMARGFDDEVPVEPTRSRDLQADLIPA